MHNRIRVIMTQEGMRSMRKPLTYGYLISLRGARLFILEDNKKSIVRYHRSFWKAYHEEENF